MFSFQPPRSNHLQSSYRKADGGDLRRFLWVRSPKSKHPQSSNFAASTRVLRRRLSRRCSPSSSLKHNPPPNLQPSKWNKPGRPRSLSVALFLTAPSYPNTSPPASLLSARPSFFNIRSTLCWLSAIHIILLWNPSMTFPVSNPSTSGCYFDTTYTNPYAPLGLREVSPELQRKYCESSTLLERRRC